MRTTRVISAGWCSWATAGASRSAMRPSVGGRRAGRGKIAVDSGPRSPFEAILRVSVSKGGERHFVPVPSPFDLVVPWSWDGETLDVILV